MSQPEVTKKKYLSLRIKIWIGFTLIFTPVFVASYIWFYLYTTQKVLNNISASLVDTVEGAVKGMDVNSFVNLYEEEKANNPLCSPSTGEARGYYPNNDTTPYWEHVKWLATVSSVVPQARLYTYVKGDKPGEIIAIGSSGALWTPPAGFSFCYSYISETTRIYEGLSHRVDSWKPYKDPYGEWITTYMPIPDKEGKIIGAIGVDISASYVRDVQYGIKLYGLIAFAGSYLLIFILVYIMSGVVTRPLISLAHVSADIGEGKYDQNLGTLYQIGPFEDEIDTLTKTFEIMIDKVALREQNLRARVQQLEIMVDKSKLDKQVQEIVESDFFQDLRSKVQDMRSRFKQE
jgi:HAMP domain-containing protein